MPPGRQRNQIRARRIEDLLEIYRETPTGTFELALRKFNAQHADMPYAIDEPQCLVTDLLADMRHFARHRQEDIHALLRNHPDGGVVSSPELKGLIDDLRKFADEHGLCWETTLDCSMMHFETEMRHEIYIS